MKGISLTFAWLFTAIFTFGHAMNTLPREEGGPPIFGAVVCSIFCPLYWSTEAWEMVLMESVQSVSASPALEGGAK